MPHYSRAARPRITAADRAAARAELARMRSAADWSLGVGRITAAQHAAELERIESQRVDAVRRGIL